MRRPGYDWFGGLWLRSGVNGWHCDGLWSAAGGTGGLLVNDKVVVGGLRVRSVRSNVDHCGRIRNVGLRTGRQPGQQMLFPLTLNLHEGRPNNSVKGRITRHLYLPGDSNSLQLHVFAKVQLPNLTIDGKSGTPPATCSMCHKCTYLPKSIQIHEMV